MTVCHMLTVRVELIAMRAQFRYMSYFFCEEVTPYLNYLFDLPCKCLALEFAPTHSKIMPQVAPTIGSIGLYSVNMTDRRVLYIYYELRCNRTCNRAKENNIFQQHQFNSFRRAKATFRKLRQLVFASSI